MFGRGKKDKVVHSAETHPAAISVDGFDFLADSIEVARLWVENEGPATCLIQPDVLQEPEMFGMLLVDTVRHAARAYAQCYGMSEEEALQRLLVGFDAERANNTTGIDTVQDYGKAN